MFAPLLKHNFSLVQKICFAGLLIAIATILQKVVAINYISVVPFLRVSLGGPATIIFASIFLGPWFGLLIGAASDILGYFIFDPKTMGFFPQITAIYAVLGFVSYFIFKLIMLVKNKNHMRIIEYISIALVVIGTSLFMGLNNQVTLYGTTYNIELWQKILIPSLGGALFIVLIVVTELTSKLFEKKNDPRLVANPHQISFSCFLIEILVMLLFGTLMKACAFGFATFGVIVICQLIVMVINVPLNTFIISYIMLLTKGLK